LAEIQRSCSWKGKPIAPEKNFQREWEICVCWFSEVVWTGDCYTTPVPSSENRLVSCTWSSVCFSAVFGGVLARERVSLGTYWEDLHVPEHWCSIHLMNKFGFRGWDSWLQSKTCYYTGITCGSYFFCCSETGSCYVVQLPLNLWSSCLSPQSGGITGV
jgi:hypothetical protein